MKNYVRYALGVLFVVVVIVLLVVGFNFIRNLLTTDKPQPIQQETKKTVGLLDAGKAGSPVRYTVRGLINGNEQHQSIRITVDSSNRKVEILQGYEDTIVKSQETPNTQEAYNAFISAINGAGFSNTIAPEGRGEEAQSCPLGRRLNFEISPGASDALRTWSTTCGTKLGTFGGNGDLVRRLFQLQVPNYTTFARDAKLG